MYSSHMENPIGSKSRIASLIETRVPCHVRECIWTEIVGTLCAKRNGKWDSPGKK